MNPLGITTKRTAVRTITAPADTIVVTRWRNTICSERSYQRSSQSKACSVARPSAEASWWEAFLRKRLHSIGVNVTETTPEIRMATQMVTENSRKSRPRTPPMKSTGMNTAASDSVMDTIVKPISLDPVSDASSGSSPISM